MCNITYSLSVKICKKEIESLLEVKHKEDNIRE